MVSDSLRVAAAMLLAAAVWPAQAAPLGLDDALRFAEQRSRQLPAQQAAATAAREMAAAAGQRPDPVLKAGIDNLPIDGSERFSITRDFMTMRSIGVMQEFTRADKLRARAARFEREAEVAEARRVLALANLQRDTAAAWLDRYHQERLRDLLRAQRDEATLQVQAAETAYRSGRGAQADVFAARAAAAQIDNRLASTESDVGTARTMLTRWIGPAAEQPLGEPPAMQAVQLREDDLETTLANHPDIAVMLKQEAAAQADVETARAGKRPDWNVELTVSQRGSTYSNLVSLNVSVPLQWDQSHRQDRELAAKLAMVEQMRAQREEETRMHVAEAKAMLRQWHGNRERLRRYDAELLPLAGDRTQAALAAYRGGSGPLIAVLDARRAEIDTRLERLRLEMDTARLWAQLNFLVPAGHGHPENPQ